MLTVLVKTWLYLGPGQTPENPVYEEDVFETARAVYHPPGRLAPCALLSCDDRQVDLGSPNRTVYVMNSSGKTVATYRGDIPIGTQNISGIEQPE